MQSYRLGTTVAMDRSVRIVRPDKVQAYEPGGHAKTENRRLLKTDQVVRVWAEEMYNNRAWLQRFNQLKHAAHIFPLEKILDTGEE
jgi:hypothetical protein